MFNLFLHKYSIFHKSSLWGSMVPAETLNLHVLYILLFFFILVLPFPRQRAQNAWTTIYSKEDIYFFNHWVQNHCTLIVTYCITSNAEHVATLRASVKYHQLESTKSILISSERLIVCWNVSSLLWFFSVNSLDVPRIPITLDNTFLQ